MNAIVRRCFAVDLVNEPEMIARYRAWHAPGGPPQAVTDAIRADGVRDLQIWLVGDRMFMMIEQDAAMAADAEGKAARDAANPDVQAWDALMRTFQQPLPFAPDTTWVEMEQIYALSKQP
ncbi:L-rhamnose mutarotase [Novosphingobium kaempferiae]|uniref:L-rhamnose mutarotase n=1 Tax=Novosphingobium kaempferiae TaxID=2896849 RepID=UPI001E45353A|nr:L-rhamnose mutarotase [Novosphingobium kaempferiae]